MGTGLAVGTIWRGLAVSGPPARRPDHKNTGGRPRHIRRGFLVRLTADSTGRDNRSAHDPLPEGPAAEAGSCRQQCQGPQLVQPLRALVILRGGLTADSTRRTLPELKRPTGARERPRRPGHQPPGKGQIVATIRNTTPDPDSQAGRA